MYCHHIKKIGHQPKWLPFLLVASRKCFLVPIRAREFGITRQVRPSRQGSAGSFSTPRVDLVLTHGFLSFLNGAHPYCQSPSGKSQVLYCTVPMAFTAKGGKLPFSHAASCITISCSSQRFATLRAIVFVLL